MLNTFSPAPALPEIMDSDDAMAAAAEQEKLAEIEESRAKLVEAEAEVPRAMAESFRSGRLGILDYYRLRNVQADTDMRTAIADSGQKRTPQPVSN